MSTAPDAWGLCVCMCLCYNGGSGPDGRCPDCQAGQHSTTYTDADRAYDRQAFALDYGLTDD